MDRSRPASGTWSISGLGEDFEDLLAMLLKKLLPGRVQVPGDVLRRGLLAFIHYHSAPRRQVPVLMGPEISALCPG